MLTRGRRHTLTSAVRKLPAAQEDLLQIWLRIAPDSFLDADHFLDFLDEILRLLATSPRMCRLYPELGDSLRGFPAKDYIIFYWEVPQGIDVVRVLHGARDIEGLFHAS
jgi:toxin ParE1/3/4